MEWGDAVENVKQRPSDIEEDERVAGDTFSAGTFRMIHGLRNDTELNGQQVEILSYNSAKCRYVVRDGNGRTVSVKAQNLVQPCRECLPGWLHGVPFTLYDVPFIMERWVTLLADRYSSRCLFCLNGPLDERHLKRCVEVSIIRKEWRRRYDPSCERDALFWQHLQGVAYDRYPVAWLLPSRGSCRMWFMQRMRDLWRSFKQTGGLAKFDRLGPAMFANRADARSPIFIVTMHNGVQTSQYFAKKDLGLGNAATPGAVRDALVGHFRETAEKTVSRPWKRSDAVQFGGAAYERSCEKRAVDAQAQLDSILELSGKLYHSLKIVKTSKQLRSISGKDIRVDLHPNIFEDGYESSADSSSSSD